MDTLREILEAMHKHGLVVFDWSALESYCETIGVELDTVMIPKQTPLPRMLVRQQDLEERGFDPALYRAAVQAYQENPSSTTVDLMGMTHPVLWMTEEEQEADIDQDNFTLDTILKALEITDKYK